MVRLRSPAPNKFYGGIPERPKGADCKSVVTDFAGPNPASPTITKNRVLATRFFVMLRKAGAADSAAKPYAVPHTASAVSGVMRNCHIKF